MLKGCSLFVEFDDFRLQFVQVRALEVILLILLLQKRQVLLNLLLFGQVQLALHSRQSLNLGVLGDFALELLSFDPFAQHVDLVLVEVLDGVDHHLLLSLLHRLILLEDLLLLEELVLLKIGSQSVDFLAEAHLLGVSLVEKRFLLVDQLLLELLFADILELHLPCYLLLNPPLLSLSALMPGFLLMRVLLKQGLILALLPTNPLHGLSIIVLLLRGALVGRVG